jgi:hypothetical protein
MIDDFEYVKRKAKSSEKVIVLLLNGINKKPSGILKAKQHIVWAISMNPQLKNYDYYSVQDGKGIVLNFIR